MAYFIKPTNCCGAFTHKETKAYFEFRATDNEWALAKGFGYEIAVATQGFLNDSGVRFARILKTVAHVLVDEDEIESWPIKSHWRI